MGIGYVLIGFLAGIISGLGIGGGALLIPALTMFFAVDQLSAQHINLLYFIPTAAIALVTHKNKGNIEKKGLIGLIGVGLAGAAISSAIAIHLDAEWLRRCFGFFLLGMGTYEFFKKEPATQTAQTK